MKEQENSPEELNERGASDLSGIEFGVMIIRILSSMKKDNGNHKKAVRNKECNIGNK